MRPRPVLPLEVPVVRDASPRQRLADVAHVERAGDPYLLRPVADQAVRVGGVDRGLHRSVLHLRDLGAGNHPRPCPPQFVPVPSGAFVEEGACPVAGYPLLVQQRRRPVPIVVDSLCPGWEQAVGVAGPVRGDLSRREFHLRRSGLSQEGEQVARHLLRGQPGRDAATAPLLHLRERLSDLVADHADLLGSHVGDDLPGAELGVDERCGAGEGSVERRRGSPGPFDVHVGGFACLPGGDEPDR